MHKRNTRFFVSVSAILALSTSLAGCSNAGTSPNHIAFVLGNGEKSAATVKEIHMPGNSFSVNKATEDVFYVPSGPRNYIIGKPEGDIKDKIVAYGKDGLKAKVSAELFWSINHNKKVLEDHFWPICQKYSCASKDEPDAGSTSNGGTPGWNKMLRTEFKPAMELSVQKTLKNINLSNIDMQDINSFENANKELSDHFEKEIAIRLGTTSEVFCGSGKINKGNSNEACPSKVRFRITKVEPYDTKVSDELSKKNNNEALIELNKVAKQAADAKYGAEKSGEILGNLDMIEACSRLKVKCTVVIGKPVNTQEEQENKKE